MPYPPYETVAVGETFFRSTIGDWVPILFIITLFMIPSYITTDKETGVNVSTRGSIDFCEYEYEYRYFILPGSVENERS